MTVARALREASDGSLAAKRASPTDRKHATLRRASASHVRSIADAVDLKDGAIFLVCAPGGDVRDEQRGGYGLYMHDCRFLSRYVMQLGPGGWDELGVDIPHGATAIIRSTNPRLKFGDVVIDKQALVATWSRTLDGSGPRLHDRLSVANHGMQPLDLPVSLRFASDFRDVYAIRSLLHGDLGQLAKPRWDGGTLRLGYTGSDEIERTTDVTIDPPPDETSDADATLVLHIEPGAIGSLDIEVLLQERPAKGNVPRPHTGPRPAKKDDWLDHACVVESSDPTFQRVIDRAMLELRSLRSHESGERYFAAGVPWFVSLFGRDSIIAAHQVLMLDAGIAADTVRLLAARQGTKRDTWRDEEPGKILHELRVGEYARTDRIPQTPYFGTVDATPLFLMLIAAHASWNGDLGLFRETRTAIDAALDWVGGPGDTDGDGFVDYDSGSDQGLANQGWKDSGDAIVDAEGNLARPPVSLVEVQGYVYAAELGIADLFERDGDLGRATELRQQAETLRAAFEDRFWIDDRIGYALALQGNGRACAVTTSNPGHALWAGIMAADRAEITARLLMEPRMFSGWGVRTYAADQPRFDPVGYHLGTVWPHDNAIIAAGLRRYGFDEAAGRVAQGIIDAATEFPDHRLPEVFAGFERQRMGAPFRYPVACHPQAWAAGSIPSLLTTLLGLRPEAFERRLSDRAPHASRFGGTNATQRAAGRPREGRPLVPPRRPRCRARRGGIERRRRRGRRDGHIRRDPRRHGDDDMNARPVFRWLTGRSVPNHGGAPAHIPPGWDYDPSAWSERIPLAALATAGMLIASYLAAYQLRIIDSVIEPFFGDGSQRVLDSSLSRALPIPDAVLGAAAYAADALAGLVGGAGRWRRHPWLVLAFGFAVGPLGAISILLVLAQPLLLHAFCTLCLVSALISVLLIGPAMDEVLATLQLLRRTASRGDSAWQALWHGEGHAVGGKLRAARL